MIDAEQRVEDLAENYLDRCQRGERPDRAALLAANADIADALARQLDLMDLMHHTKQELNSLETCDGAQASDPDTLPQQVGCYEIRELIGRGAKFERTIVGQD